MVRSKTHKFVGIVTLVLSLMIMMVVGCSRSPMSFSQNQPETELLKRSSRAVSSAQLSTATLYAEQVISAADGGRIELLDVILEIPPGAVPNDTLFSIGIPDLQVFYNEFGTDGLVFDVPVTVVMSYRDADLSGVDLSTLRIAWHNLARDAFEALPCVIDTVNETVTAEVNHFSAYGLISDLYTGPPM